MARSFSTPTFIILMLLIAAPHAAANSSFTNQAVVPTGSFQWDAFSGAAFAGPHEPDVHRTGQGAATLRATAAGATGFPFPMLIPASRNLYAGTGIGTFTPGVDGADVSESDTTVVLQIAALGAVSPGSMGLSGAAPVEFVDRGMAPDGLNYYWAEWNVASSSWLVASFTAAGPHFSLAGAQLDYFNRGTPFNASPAVLVPEPSALMLIAVGLAGAAMARVRRRPGAATRYHESTGKA